MQTTRSLPVAAALLAALAGLAPAATTLYVATDGDDKGKGTKASPLATLEAARDAIRQMKRTAALPAGGITVEVGAGTYVRRGPLELTAKDSGTAEAPIVYRAAAGAEVRLAGGQGVKDFRPVTDRAVLDRLEPAARGKVLQADLKAQGITDYGALARRGFAEPGRVAHMELFFDDRPMTLARWPNQGYVPVTSLPDGKEARTFGYAGDRPRRWANEPDAWVYGYWYHDWADTYMKIEKVDPDKRTITTRAPRHRYGLRKSQRWCAINVLSELDSPGEYYVDRERGRLYFWPPGPIGSGRAVVSLAEQLLVLKDCAHVTLRGFVLEACRGIAVRITGGSHNRLAGCTIRNIGNRAAIVSGRENAVIGCDIYAAGEGGISLSGGDRRTLTPARLLAENNHIHHYSRWCHTYRSAVGVSGCGNVVRHNLIHHGHHNGIQLSGNDHLIELNEVHSVCWDTGDVGAFYMGRDWSARGTVIRHNYWHHVQGPGQHGAMGVYLDDQASGITIFGNVFYRASRAMFIGGGCDNVVENNVFVDCNPAVHIDARGLGWQKKATQDPKATLRRQLAAVPYRNALWSKRYRNLPNILKDDPGTPKRNRVVRNISVGGRWENIHRATRKYQVVENNLVETDPHFVNAKALDFRLKKTSPALKLGFRPIPIEKIGLYKDELRASWPVRHSPRKLPAPAARRRAAAGPQPVCSAGRGGQAVKIDGRITRGEWPGKPLTLAENFNGDKVARTSKAWVLHDAAHLYMAFDNTVRARPALKRGTRWGGSDAVEIAIQNISAGKGQPVLVLRGYADAAGTFESVEEAGAPAEAARRAARGVEYKASVVSPTRWTAEWKVPFASLGIDSARQRKFALNLSVRKTADDLWLMWHSTRGDTHAVDRAGILVLGATATARVSKPRAKTRNPNTEIRRKLETRIPKRPKRPGSGVSEPRICRFEFPSSFGFRVSDL